MNTLVLNLIVSRMFTQPDFAAAVLGPKREVALEEFKEKLWSADMAFLLNIEATDVLKFTQAIHENVTKNEVIVIGGWGHDDK